MASRGIAHEVVTDVVEYMIVLMPDVGSLALLVPALAELFDTTAVRILDLVVLVTSRDGAVRVLELEEVDSMAQLRDAGRALESLLSDHDVELAVRVLRPDAAALVLLTEDRWAGPLSTAARRAGGEIVAGERIARSRMEAALAEAANNYRGGE